VLVIKDHAKKYFHGLPVRWQLLKKLQPKQQKGGRNLLKLIEYISPAQVSANATFNILGYYGN
jgi:hypothetical protein